jgi:Restriction endonuclease NotI
MASKIRERFGIGEWFGMNFESLSPEEIREIALTIKQERQCPFRGNKCRKKGGICSLRQYRCDGSLVTGIGGLVTVCPERFKQENTAVSAISSELLGTKSPIVVNEIPFLKSYDQANESSEAVGQIDMVLFHLNNDVLKWCSLEVQSVYFSGPGMESKFKELSQWTGPGIPFPDKVRRPDFRSSGPKRLMPQLQMKVPTITRWGSKMVVLVDKAFWESLAPMRPTLHISNSDIVWFVVDYRLENNHWKLFIHGKYPVTLADAVDGLTGGEPVSQEEFEAAILKKSLKP